MPLGCGAIGAEKLHLYSVWERGENRHQKKSKQQTYWEMKTIKLTTARWTIIFPFAYYYKTLNGIDFNKT